MIFQVEACHLTTPGRVVYALSRRDANDANIVRMETIRNPPADADQLVGHYVILTVDNVLILRGVVIARPSAAAPADAKVAEPLSLEFVVPCLTDVLTPRKPLVQWRELKEARSDDCDESSQEAFARVIRQYGYDTRLGASAASLADMVIAALEAYSKPTLPAVE